MKNKTFRLFISSTFNDFTEERKILQTKVFPQIKEYASTKGYSFQPIDLRWGVNNEAQLDQKTLELCLSEVRACKTNPHPNFLIMIGDRYGWIPLPFAIEEQEFATLLQLMTRDEMEEILEWYKLDLNQLPASYILKERTEGFEDYDTWLKVESKLRKILQIAANRPNLGKEQKRKYFLSATEAEVEEGILPYGSLTNFQKDVLLPVNNDVVKVDPKHIFGFFRDIDKSTQIENTFIVDDYDKARIFKKEVKKELCKDNTLHVKTKQIDKDTLEYSYIKEFEERAINFLISQVDEQKSNEMVEELTPLEIELKAQRYFVEQKRKDFIAQEDILKDIDSYISSQSNEALIIYGKSGIGKSSIIAKAVQEAEDKIDGSKKVLYRFIGATPYSSSSKEILTSLFEELGIDIRSENEKKEIKNTTIQGIDDKQDTFEQFSYRIYDEIRNIKEDLVVFIDAVDQLVNDEQFLWLPNNLPSNVKIIISALSDEKYEESTQYFKTLKKKIKVDNLIEIADFSEPKQLLYSLLKKENRTLQEDQVKYFLEQYKTANSPLYVVVALQKLKHWKSYDYVEGSASKEHGVEQDLKPTQQGIIEEFIENLSGVYHHNKEFVSKVLGYIYASRDGLSESELLQLISTDKDFVEKVAPQEFHKNHNLELPLVHWSRLHAQLKPFLSLKAEDSEELMYFFHREFEDVVFQFDNHRKEHEAIIEATQKLIFENQDRLFEDNRWGRLYITLITEYELHYKDKVKQKEFSEFIANTQKLQEAWIGEYIKILAKMGLYYMQKNHNLQAIAYQESCLYITTLRDKENKRDHLLAMNALALLYLNQNRVDESLKLSKELVKIAKILYDKNQNDWQEIYLNAVSALAAIYSNNKDQLEKALELKEESFKIAKILYDKNPDTYSEYYISSLSSLSIVYAQLNRLKEALESGEKSFKIVEILYDKNSKYWTATYLSMSQHLCLLYRKINYPEVALKCEKKILKIAKRNYIEKPDYYSKIYVGILGVLARIYDDYNNLEKSIELQNEALSIIKKFYIKNSEYWVNDYTLALNNLAIFYENQNSLKISKKLNEELLDVLKKFYPYDNDKWIFLYTQTIKAYIAILDRQSDECLSVKNNNEAILIYKQRINFTKALCVNNPSNTEWVKLYINSLLNLVFIYIHIKNYKEAFTIQAQSWKLLQPLYTDNNNFWFEEYVTAKRYIAILMKNRT